MFRMANAKRSRQNGESARLDGSEDAGCLDNVKGSAHDDDRSRMCLHYQASRLEAVHLGHVDVHGDDVRPGACHGFERGFSGSRGCNDLNLRIRHENVQ
jgi:hypothetical protein